jgi:cytochrome c-type biogenesis protein CcmE
VALGPGRARMLLSGGAIVAALAFLGVQLGHATNYFYTADEAVAHRASLGTRTLRIEGTVVQGSVHQDARDTRFAIQNNGVTVAVHHQGGEPAMFRPGIPVVLQGHFAGQVFQSQLIMVKHSETYRARHPDRVKDYPGPS